MTQPGDERVQAGFSAAQKHWRDALEAHRMAPPDAGFAARLSSLAEAAKLEAQECRYAHAAGFEWPPHRAADSGPPYELRPGTGSAGASGDGPRSEAACDRAQPRGDGDGPAGGRCRIRAARRCRWRARRRRRGDRSRERASPTRSYAPLGLGVLRDLERSASPSATPGRELGAGSLPH